MRSLVVFWAWGSLLTFTLPMRICLIVIAAATSLCSSLWFSDLTQRNDSILVFVLLCWASLIDCLWLLLLCPRVGPGNSRIGSLSFLAGWRKRRLNQAFNFVLVQLDYTCVHLLLVLRLCACVCRYCISFFFVLVWLILLLIFIDCTSASDASKWLMTCRAGCPCCQRPASCHATKQH